MNLGPEAQPMGGGWQCWDHPDKGLGCSAWVGGAAGR